MTINRHNYEIFLIDCLDGRLSPSVVAELISFLDKNPDIKVELDSLQGAVLVGKPVTYPNKLNLKKVSFLKNGIDNEFEYLCIALLEGAITKEENAVLKRMLADNKDKRIEFQVFKKATIKSDKAITYTNKSHLKRIPIFPIRFSTLGVTMALTSSIALLIGIYSIVKISNLNNPTGEPTKTIVATTSDAPTKTSPKEDVTNINAKSEVKTITIISRKEPISEPIKENAEPEYQRINIHDSVPSTLARIESKDIPNVCDPQREQLSLIAATYPLSHQFSDEHFYAEQVINIETSRIKGISVFEIIKYGVQTFGELAGKKILLNAKKDRNGNIEKISFDSNLIAFSTPIRKKE